MILFVPVATLIMCLTAKILQKICQASNLKVQYRNILRRSLWTQSHFHITTEVNKFPPFGGQCKNIGKNRPEGEFCTIGASRVYTVKNSSHKVY
ncbi:unnamed protein product [Rhizophagus irregularis]|nr:unnamed protein product [Rhizophagus irregularis]